MRARFVLLLAVTSLLVVAATRVAASGGVAGAAAAGVLGTAAVVCFVAIARIAYADGVGARERIAQAREVRKRI